MMSNNFNNDKIKKSNNLRRVWKIEWWPNDDVGLMGKLFTSSPLLIDKVRNPNATSHTIKQGHPVGFGFNFQHTSFIFV